MLNFLTNTGKVDSNVSDNFKHNDNYQKQFDDQLKDEEEIMKTKDVTNEVFDVFESQGNHFYFIQNNDDNHDDDPKDDNSIYKGVIKVQQLDDSNTIKKSY